MYKYMPLSCSKGDTLLAEKNLRSLHVLLTVFISRLVLTPVKKEEFLFNRVSIFGSLSINSSSLSDVYIENFILNMSDDIIHQCSISEVHWFRSMSQILLLNSEDILQNINCMHSSTSVTNSTFITSKFGSELNVLSKLDSDKFLNHVSTRKNKNPWLSMQPGTLFLEMTEHQILELNVNIARNENLDKWFPFKDGAACVSKSNIFIDNMLESLRHGNPIYYSSVKDKIYKLVGLSNDQVCCLIISHLYLYSSGFDFDLFEYRCYVHNTALVKGVSDLSKLCGVAINPFLSKFAEGDALGGRGNTPFSMMDDFNRITQNKKEKGENIEFGDNVIYNAVYKILTEAMPSVHNSELENRWRLYCEDENDYWVNRHINCVNGAHHLPKNCEIPDISPGISRNRMAWLESVKESFLFKTEPIIEATMSLKSDAPKNRSIKSSDTISYNNEDYLMRAIEKQWSHKEILLEPSLTTKVEEAQRVVNMIGNEYVMLDYKGMEYQHSLKTLVELCRAKLDFFGAPKNIHDWFMQAESNQWINCDGHRKKLVYGLLSGRRSTTFINTVLCGAYCRIALGDNLKLVTSMFCVGDDVVIRTYGRDSARKILNTCLKSQSTFNPRKQSWGSGAEFLRQAINESFMVGYLNRSIASFVCGSWVNEVRLAGTDLPSIFQRYAWTLDNRGTQDSTASQFMPYSLHKRSSIDLRVCIDLCKHKVAVNGGPVNSLSGSILVLLPRTVTQLSKMKSGTPSYASDQYIDIHIPLLESSLGQSGINSLKGTFKMASYKKGLISGYTPGRIAHTNIETFQYSSYFDLTRLANLNVGILAKHPTLPSLKSMLNFKQLDFLANLFTGKRYAGELPIEQYLFGPESGVVNSEIGQCFDDLCQIGNLAYSRVKRLAPKILLKYKVYF